MTGGMIGALRSVSALPKPWLEGLLNRKQLELRAEALLAGKPVEGMEDLYSMELRLTREETEERRRRTAK